MGALDGGFYLHHDLGGYRLASLFANTDIVFTGLTLAQLNADIQNALQTLHCDFLPAPQQLQHQQAKREFHL